MSVLKKIASATLVLGLAFTLSACSNPKSDGTAPAQESTQEADSTKSAQLVASTYEEFTNGVYNSDTDAINAFYEKYADVSSNPPEEQKESILAEMKELVPTLELIDVTGKNNDEIGTIYGTVLGLSLFSGENADSTIPNSVKVPLNAVTVGDDSKSATIDLSLIEVKMGGELVGNATGMKATFTLKDGKWLIVPTSELFGI